MDLMYPAKINSPLTSLAVSIDATQTTIEVTDASKLPAAPNIAVIGRGENAETIQYTGISSNTLTGVTRGFQGTTQAWPYATEVARYFTAYDYDTLINNLTEVDTDLATHLADLVTDTDGVHGFKVEKGMFTPEIRGQTTAGIYEYSSQNGIYLIHDDLVFFSLVISVSSVTVAGSGYLEVFNLPVVSKNTTPIRFSMAIDEINNIAFTGEFVSCQIQPGDSKLYLKGNQNNGGATIISISSIVANSSFRLSGFYQKA